jgi:hypothetical protein
LEKPLDSNACVQPCNGKFRLGCRVGLVLEAPTDSICLTLPISSTDCPHLVITTYGLIGSSPLDFCHDYHTWDYVILDEAHKIKNPSAQISKNCRRVTRSEDTRRLILTGTPIMNNLKELWALIDFATSGKLLGTLPR